MNSIIFRPELIRAILAGKKSQTRRPIKWYCGARDEAKLVNLRGKRSFVYLDFDGVPGLSWRPYGGSPTVPFPAERIGEACPYGGPGSTVRVLETWCPARGLAFEASSELLKSPAGAALRPGIIYRADGEELPPGCRWRPSIHMPRHFSRISLVLTRVRVERLRDISESDAKAEGVTAPPVDCDVYRAAFRAKWDTIYADKPGLSWQANPYIWTLDFRAERT
jgi:hypothetical protein